LQAPAPPPPPIETKSPPPKKSPKTKEIFFGGGRGKFQTLFARDFTSKKPYKGNPFVFSKQEKDYFFFAPRIKAPLFFWEN